MKENGALGSQSAQLPSSQSIMLSSPKPPKQGSVSPMSTPRLGAMRTAGSNRVDPDPFNIRTPLRAGNRTIPPHTKIVCTIGPPTRDTTSLARLMEAGMNVVRCNFSHGDHEYHAGVIENARTVMRDTKRLCAIMLDTKGPEIRTCLLKDGKDVLLARGNQFTLLVDQSVVGDETRVAVQYPNMPNVLTPGNIVLIDDGLISLRVDEVAPDSVLCTVLNDGMLGQRKGVNLPGVVVDLPAVTEKDIADIRFGVRQGVDFIAASFVRNAAAVQLIREVLGEDGSHIKIISKIENQEGLNNFDEILEMSDGIMVARGDLGVEIPIEQVALAQKMMIRKCNLAGKLVITATQMLESMVSNPSPTRAEASDVANAVFDGSDCVMLSGETAKGDYPVEAVTIMAGICREAEDNIDYLKAFHAIRDSLSYISLSISEAVASSAVKAAFDLNASLVIVFTETGNTARFVAKYRPRCPILCITSDEQVARQSLTSRGLLPLLVGSTRGQDSLVYRAVQVAKKLKMCKMGDIVVATGGAKEGVAGLTNNLKVLMVDF